MEVVVINYCNSQDNSRAIITQEHIKFSNLVKHINSIAIMPSMEVDIEYSVDNDSTADSNLMAYCISFVILLLKMVKFGFVKTQFKIMFFLIIFYQLNFKLDEVF